MVLKEMNKEIDFVQFSFLTLVSKEYATSGKLLTSLSQFSNYVNGDTL